MNLLHRLCALWLILACLSEAPAQMAGSKIAAVDIQHVGPVSVSDALIRANIRVKPGDPYLPAAVDEDIRSLYSTGLFYDVRIGYTNTPAGVVLTYIVQGNPRVSEIRIVGNKKFSESKLRKTITSRVG